MKAINFIFIYFLILGTHIMFSNSRRLRKYKNNKESDMFLLEVSEEAVDKYDSSFQIYSCRLRYKCETRL